MADTQHNTPNPSSASLSPLGEAADPSRLMAGNPFAALSTALSEAEGASLLLQDGVDMLNGLDAPGLHFIAMGLEAQVKVLSERLEEATVAARAVTPRLSHREAIRLLVLHLAKEQGLDVNEADLPALVSAYDAESAAAEPKTSAGVVFDRAIRSLKHGGTWQ